MAGAQDPWMGIKEEHAGQEGGTSHTGRLEAGSGDGSSWAGGTKPFPGRTKPHLLAWLVPCQEGLASKSCVSGSFPAIHAAPWLPAAALVFPQFSGAPLALPIRPQPQLPLPSLGSIDSLDSQPTQPTPAPTNPPWFQT